MFFNLFRRNYKLAALKNLNNEKWLNKNYNKLKSQFKTDIGFSKFIDILIVAEINDLSLNVILNHGFDFSQSTLKGPLIIYLEFNVFKWAVDNNIVNVDDNFFKLLLSGINKETFEKFKYLIEKGYTFNGQSIVICKGFEMLNQMWELCNGKFNLIYQCLIVTKEDKEINHIKWCFEHGFTNMIRNGTKNGEKFELNSVYFSNGKNEEIVKLNFN